MPVYKLYVLSAAGDVSDCYDLVGCPDDARAIAMSSSRARTRTMELWLRDRLVQSFPAATNRSRSEQPTSIAEPELGRSPSQPI
ncbi:hypothetical protein LJR219_004263 [Phenylobacterium sp. LjRoot219]|uniref:hypothetical protein n=1 Tax=Phenylobacterium sp. LjRoot219 TaxID=3342283 RepID=UPI003ECDFB24